MKCQEQEIDIQNCSSLINVIGGILSHYDRLEDRPSLESLSDSLYYIASTLNQIIGGSDNE